MKQLDEAFLLALFPVMATLEGLCTYLAAQKLTVAELNRLEAIHARLEAYAADADIDGYYEANREFHHAVQELSGNRWLNRIAAQLRNVLTLARHRQLTVPGRLLESLGEHRQIMQALRDGDADAAQQAMHDHLCRQEKILRDRTLVGCLVSSVTLRAPLLGQDKAHFAGNGRPFSRSATLYWPSSGAPFGPLHKRHRLCFARLN